ncbi:MAG: 2-oxoacid:acceptor oxidoreductase family protein [Thermoplasmata archaeon]
MERGDEGPGPAGRRENRGGDAHEAQGCGGDRPWKSRDGDGGGTWKDGGEDGEPGRAQAPSGRRAKEVPRMAAALSGGGDEGCALEGSEIVGQAGGECSGRLIKVIVRFSGFGGQGVVLMGVVLGRAVALAGKRVLQTQSYGAEARGGACHSTVTISEGPVFEIEPEEIDVLVTMSQPAHDRFIGLLRPGGTLLFDSDLVKAPRGAPSGAAGDVAPTKGLVKENHASTAGRMRGIPATALASRELGRELFANVVMLGFFVRETGAVGAEDARKALEETVPTGTVKKNLRAFEVGLGYGR